jgi:hypothetical protein
VNVNLRVWDCFNLQGCAGGQDKLVHSCVINSGIDWIILLFAVVGIVFFISLLLDKEEAKTKNEL